MKEVTFVLEDRDALALVGLAMELKVSSMSMKDVVTEATHHKKRKTPNPKRGTGKARAVMLRLMAGKPVGTELSIASMEMAFKEAGLTPSTASPTRSFFTKEGLLQKIDYGRYMITHKGADVAEKESK